jgi:hypothetical protein
MGERLASVGASDGEPGDPAGGDDEAEADQSVENGGGDRGGRGDPAVTSPRIRALSIMPMPPGMIVMLPAAMPAQNASSSWVALMLAPVMA